MSEVDRILSSCTSAELQEIYDHLAASPLIKARKQFGDRMNGKVDGDDFVALLELEIVEVMFGEGCPISLKRVKSLPDYRKFKLKAKMVEEYFASVKIKKNQRKALLNVGISCLIDYLRNIKAPIDAVTVIRNIDKIPRAIDAAFPGYASYGMLHMITRLED